MEAKEFMSRIPKEKELVPFRTVLESVHYRYKGKNYVVLSLIKSKDVVTGEWLVYVLYKRKDDERQAIYARCANEFIAKFKPLIVGKEDLDDQGSN